VAAVAAERQEINPLTHQGMKQTIQQVMVAAVANLEERAFKGFLDYQTVHH
jgi:hypothetical protein